MEKSIRKSISLKWTRISRKIWSNSRLDRLCVFYWQLLLFFFHLLRFVRNLHHPHPSANLHAAHVFIHLPVTSPYMKRNDECFRVPDLIFYANNMRLVRHPLCTIMALFCLYVHTHTLAAIVGHVHSSSSIQKKKRFASDANSKCVCASGRALMLSENICKYLCVLMYSLSSSRSVLPLFLFSACRFRFALPINGVWNDTTHKMLQIFNGSKSQQPPSTMLHRPLPRN